MKLSEVRRIIREEVRLLELGRTGLPGAVEKDINVSLRDKYKQDNINYGGCGIMAELLYYACKKHLKITPEIIVITAGLNNKLKYLERLNLNAKDLRSLAIFDGFYVMHVIIRIPNTNICLDSTGFHTLNNFIDFYNRAGIKQEAKHIAGVTYNDTATISTLTKWVRDPNSWNDSFSRNRIPNLTKEIYDMMEKAAKIPEIKNKIGK